MVPDSSRTSHSTVGLPRLSRISRPTMSTIALISFLSSIKKSKTFDDDHPHHRGTLSGGACLGVFGRGVELFGGFQAGELEHHDALRMPVALERLDRPAAHADL